MKIILGIIIGAVLVLLFLKRQKSGALNPQQQKQKQENLAKVLELARTKAEIRNDDVEKTLNVSNATAERYLNELEAQGKLEQIGKTGQSVVYRLK